MAARLRSAASLARPNGSTLPAHWSGRWRHSATPPPSDNSIGFAMHPGRNDYLLLLLLGAVWGFSFLLIKLAVVTIPPLSVATGRICLGAALLLLVAIIRGTPLRQLRASWLPLLAMG